MRADPDPGGGRDPKTRTHWGAAPLRPPLGFLRGGPGSTVIFFYRLILLFLTQRHMFLTSYFINVVNPVVGQFEILSLETHALSISQLCFVRL